MGHRIREENSVGHRHLGVKGVGRQNLEHGSSRYYLGKTDEISITLATKVMIDEY